MRRFLNVFFYILIFLISSCDDTDSKDSQDETEVGYIAFTTSGIIDFSTDAYEIDTMYVWANFDGYQVCASYDTLAIESLLIDEIYDPVNPGTYTWRGKGITFGLDMDLQTLVYDTNVVSGQFSISDGDICILSITIDDSLKIGKTEKNCSEF